jgi:hypothetical protein
MRPPLARRALLAATALLAACAGCLGEPPRPKEDPRVHADVVPAPVRFAAVGDARVGSGAPATTRLQETVSDLSQIQGLDFVILAGNMVANEDAAKTAGDVKEVASAFGILTAKKYFVLGRREKEGAAAKDDVARALAASKLVPSEVGYYSDAPRPGVRVIVLDTWVGPDDVKAQRAWLADTLRDAKEDTIVVAAPTEFGPVFADPLAQDPRVKAVVLGSTTVRDWTLPKAIVDAPSLAQDGRFVSAELGKMSLVERVLTPGNPVPSLESKHNLAGK